MLSISNAIDNYCYVRQLGGEGWTRARNHQRDALLSFLNTPISPNGLEIEVSITYREDDQEVEFNAIFGRHRHDNIFYYNHDGRHFDILIITDHSYVAFLNALNQ